MQIKKKIEKVLKTAFTQGWTTKKLALSFCTGIYIAFSPFPGGHTIMIFLAKWLLNINFPILFLVASINNPWTMIPLYTFEYIFGHWFTHNLLGLNPSWAIPLAKIFGSGKICIWSFFIGGNLIGIIFALSSYPLIKIFFQKMVTKLKVVKS